MDKYALKGSNSTHPAEELILIEGRCNMEVEAEEQPKVHHRKMGPKGSRHQDQDVQDEAMVDVFGILG
ncbi:unnamed protein product [Cylicostephanus goldi]|uniref:Uncharacterized protein n=1 Tax=Cylicostephanus goldi TaxID=71465 RepID=A0A3P6SEA7_CYLGO|nr:unnamed protein product [Cylicostephanus goldi]